MSTSPANDVKHATGDGDDTLADRGLVELRKLLRRVLHEVDTSIERDPDYCAKVLKAMRELPGETSH